MSPLVWLSAAVAAALLMIFVAVWYSLARLERRGVVLYRRRRRAAVLALERLNTDGEVCECRHTYALHDTRINSAGVCQEMSCFCVEFRLKG